jgi:hypothetical protein
VERGWGRLLTGELLHLHIATDIRGMELPHGVPTSVHCKYKTFPSQGPRMDLISAPKRKVQDLMDSLLNSIRPLKKN